MSTAVWTKTATGWRHTNGAELLKHTTRTGRTKAWTLVLPTGRSVQLCARASFDTAERLMVAS